MPWLFNNKLWSCELPIIIVFYPVLPFCQATLIFIYLQSPTLAHQSSPPQLIISSRKTQQQQFVILINTFLSFVRPFRLLVNYYVYKYKHDYHTRPFASSSSSSINLWLLRLKILLKIILIMSAKLVCIVSKGPFSLPPSLSPNSFRRLLICFKFHLIICTQYSAPSTSSPSLKNMSLQFRFRSFPNYN